MGEKNKLGKEKEIQNNSKNWAQKIKQLMFFAHNKAKEQRLVY